MSRWPRVFPTIVTLADRWRVEYAEPEIEVRRTQGQEAASRLVATGAGRHQFDQLRASVDALGASIAAHAQAATDAGDDGLANRRLRR